MIYGVFGGCYSDWYIIAISVIKKKQINTAVFTAMAIIL